MRINKMPDELIEKNIKVLQSVNEMRNNLADFMSLINGGIDPDFEYEAEKDALLKALERRSSNPNEQAAALAMCMSFYLEKFSGRAQQMIQIYQNELRKRTIRKLPDS